VPKKLNLGPKKPPKIMAKKVGRSGSATETLGVQARQEGEGVSQQKNRKRIYTADCNEHTHPSEGRSTMPGTKPKKGPVAKASLEADPKS